MQDIIFPKHKKAILESLHERQAPRRDQSRPGRGRKYFFRTGCALIILATLWYGSSALSTADVYITPRKESLALDDTLVASRASTTPQDTITFQIMTIDDESSVSVPATKKESVTDSAKGTVVLYNLTGLKQKLIARTRLEAPTGKIYRLMSDVTIPASKKVSGKILPGSVESRVEAALPGEAYNSDLTDFTIPGFKGSAKFTKFYGRSKTKITGGFLGERLIASPEELKTARAGLKTALADKLAKTALGSLPDGWIMYKDGTFLELSEKQSAHTSDKDKITLTETGILRAIILKESDLLDYVIDHKLQDTDDTSGFRPGGFENLQFVIKDRPAFSISGTETFIMTLKGALNLTAEVPSELIKADLAGTSLKSTASVFRKYPGIERVSAIKIRPGFLRTLPDDKDKIFLHIKETP